MKRLFRNANIGLAVATFVLLAGFWPVRESETATGALGLIAFIVGMGVYIGLNLRDEHTRRKGSPGPG